MHSKEMKKYLKTLEADADEIAIERALHKLYAKPNQKTYEAFINALNKHLYDIEELKDFEYMFNFSIRVALIDENFEYLHYLKTFYNAIGQSIIVLDFGVNVS